MGCRLSFYDSNSNTWCWASTLLTMRYVLTEGPECRAAYLRELENEGYVPGHTEKKTYYVESGETTLRWSGEHPHHWTDPDNKRLRGTTTVSTA